MMAAGTGPNFREPPVVETVLGVQFDPLPRLASVHLGAFWAELDGDWGDVTDALPLPLEYERFGVEQTWARVGLMQLSIGSAPATRVQARNGEQSRMIQLQNGRLHYNWLGRSSGAYPRYQAIRAEFLPLVERFRRFLEAKGLGELRPNQWEVTYLNHLPAGTVWNVAADWSRAFASDVAWPLELPNSLLESFSGEWHYEIVPQRGRLHVAIAHGREEAQGAAPRDLLIFKLTARGAAKPSEAGWGVADGLDLGHDTIVRSFTRLASEAARQVWKEET